MKHLIRILFTSLILSLVVSCGGGGAGTEKPAPTPKPLDSDNDGVPDSSDAFPNDPSETKDSDTDGVGDNSDVFPNDALEWSDTDEDGVGDNADVFPTDAAEWKDTDGDGVGNNGDPTPLGEPIPAWKTYQGSPEHNSHIAVTLDSANFTQRWDAIVPNLINDQGVVADGYVFVSTNTDVRALSVITGEVLWTRAVSGPNPPAYESGRVYVQTGGHSNAALWCFDAATGSTIYKTPLADQWSSFYAPTVYDGVVHLAGGYYGGMYAIGAETGEILWWVGLNQYDEFTPAVTDEYVYAYTGSYSPQLTVVDRVSGELVQTIEDPNFNWNGWSMDLAPVVVDGDVFAIHNYRLLKFDTTSGVVGWEVADNFTGQPVVADGNVYALNAGNITVHSADTGEALAVWETAEVLFGDLLIVNNLVFAKSEQDTYAFDRESGELVWTQANVSGNFMLAEGALAIVESGKITLFDVEGDIDNDGLPDWWEKLYATDVEPQLDVDVDGLTGLQEFEFRTSPIDPDTDGDGLNDGDEVLTHNSNPNVVDSDYDGLNDYDELITWLTNPLLSDSDEDGLSDYLEVSVLLDPNDSADATLDSDGDKYSNFYEAMAGTNWNDAADLPVVNDWGMVQGNAKHNGYQALLLDESDFELRWQKQFEGAIRPVASGEEKVFVTHTQWPEGTAVHALDSANGDSVWRFDFGDLHSASGPSFAGGSMYMHSGGHELTALWRLNASDGAFGYLAAHGSQWSSYSAPTIFGDGAYINGGYYGGILAKELETGTEIWSLDDATSADNWEPAVNDDYVFYPSDNGLVVASRATGESVSVIGDTPYTATPVLGSMQNVILGGESLESFDLATGALNWSVLIASPLNKIAVGNGRVYVYDSAILYALDELTGKVQWSWETPNARNLSSNVVATISHIFVSTSENTYALNAATGESVWSYSTGGELALSAEGALYITNLNANTLYSINISGDADEDGLPDWWEIKFGLDFSSSSDVNLDNDSDGVTNLEEFSNGSNPLVTDTDGDGISDYEEIFTYTTSPRVRDTDKDGLPDDWEIQYGQDPLVSDSTLDADGDLVDSINEFVAGTDPTDSSSAPVILADEAYSFENQDLPVGWALTANSSGVGVSSENASDGTYSLVSSNAFGLEFGGFFLARDLFFDVNSECDYWWSSVSVYVDGELVFQEQLSGGWQTHSAPIPYGQHNVVVDFTSSNCDVSVDNFRFVEPTSLWGWGAQFGVLFDARKLNFYREDETIVRSVLLPDSSSSAYGDFFITASGLVAVLDYQGDKVRVYNPINHQWQSFTSSDWNNTASSKAIAGVGEYAFIVSKDDSENVFKLVRIDLASGASQSVDIPERYSFTDLVAGLDGRIYVLVGGDVYQFDADSLALLNSYGLSDATAIAVAQNGDLYAFSNTREVRRYNSSRLIVDQFFVEDARAEDLEINERREIFALEYYSGIAKVNASLTSSSALNLTGSHLAILPFHDEDSDTLPDWWEVQYGLDWLSDTDATLDLDGDTLSAVEEFEAGTNPNLLDSDGDELSDYDEIYIHNTDPINADTDDDGLSDGVEVNTWLTNPLVKDSDEDTFSDMSEVLVFDTNPNDPESMPVAIEEMTESFETDSGGFLLTESEPGWYRTELQSADGTFSLRSGEVGNSQSSSVSFTGVFAGGTLSFDARTSSENCCDRLIVYLNDQLVINSIVTAELWENYAFELSAGENTIMWVYKKDSSASFGEDAAYIDNIVFN